MQIKWDRGFFKTSHSIRIWSILTVNCVNRELKQIRCRRQRERHLKMKLRFSAILSQLFKVIALAKCVLTILELNWNQRFWDKMPWFNICSRRPHHCKRGHFTSSKEWERLQTRCLLIYSIVELDNSLKNLKNLLKTNAMLAVSFKKFNNISTKIVFYYGFRRLKINVSVLIMSITKFSISASLRNRQNT